MPELRLFLFALNLSSSSLSSSEPGNSNGSTFFFVRAMRLRMGGASAARAQLWQERGASRHAHALNRPLQQLHTPGAATPDCIALFTRTMRPHACGSGGEHSGGEHSSGGSRPSTRPPTKQHKRHAHAGAAGATGQPARGRHAPRCAAADARSVGRGSGLAALPRPSQCRPEKGPV